MPYDSVPFTIFEDNVAAACASTEILEAARAYRFCGGTRKAYEVGMSKYDLPPISRPADFEDAVDEVILYFARFVLGVEFTTEAHMRANTSNGRWMTWGNKTLKQKEDWLRDASPHYLPWYLNGGYKTIKAIWGASVKRELKSRKKCELEDFRIFLIPPTDFATLQALYCQPLDEAFARHSDNPDFPLKVGMTKEYGGLQRQIEHLSRKFRYRIASDVVKFDGNFQFWVMNGVYRVRRNLTVSKHQDWSRKIEYELTHPWVLLPNGQLVQLRNGHCSGSGSTAQDGSLGHFLGVVYLCRRWGLKYGTDVQVIIGADDIIWFSNTPLPFEKRMAGYQLLGWSLKQEEDVSCDGTLDGLSFYGMTYVALPTPHLIPRRSKMLSAILQLDSYSDVLPERLMQRLAGIRPYFAYDDEGWDFIEKVRAAHTECDWAVIQLPSREYYQRYYWKTPCHKEAFDRLEQHAYWGSDEVYMSNYRSVIGEQLIMGLWGSGVPATWVNDRDFDDPDTLACGSTCDLSWHQNTGKLTIH